MTMPRPPAKNQVVFKATNVRDYGGWGYNLRIRAASA